MVLTRIKEAASVLFDKPRAAFPKRIIAVIIFSETQGFAFKILAWEIRFRHDFRKISRGSFWLNNVGQSVEVADKHVLSCVPRRPV